VTSEGQPNEHMLTRTRLEETFKVYFDEMERCVQGRCYWALLHLLVVLPDVCAALESTNGRTSEKQYQNWCERYLADNLLTGCDWYTIRCGVLHQGRTVDEKRKSQYVGFSFSQPNEMGLAVMRTIRAVKHGKILCMDVGDMATQVQTAMRKWFEFLEQNGQSDEVQNVIRHSEMLARSGKSSDAPLAIDMFRIQNYTTSSPF